MEKNETFPQTFLAIDENDKEKRNLAEQHWLQKYFCRPAPKMTSSGTDWGWFWGCVKTRSKSMVQEESGYIVQSHRFESKVCSPHRILPWVPRGTGTWTGYRAVTTTVGPGVTLKEERIFGFPVSPHTSVLPWALPILSELFLADTERKRFPFFIFQVLN